MRTRCVALLAICLLLAADGPGAAPKKDLDQLQGAWTAVSIEYNGDKVLGDIVKEMKVVIDGDKLTLGGEGTDFEKYGKATLKIDPTTTPKIMDIHITAGGEKGTTLEAIYTVTGAEWKLCLKLTGKERPAQFESKAESNDVLVVFQRAKK